MFQVNVCIFLLQLVTLGMLVLATQDKKSRYIISTLTDLNSNLSMTLTKNQAFNGINELERLAISGWDPDQNSVS